jgi:hypothetical protein
MVIPIGKAEQELKRLRNTEISYKIPKPKMDWA